MRAPVVSIDKTICAKHGRVVTAIPCSTRPRQPWSGSFHCSDLTSHFTHLNAETGILYSCGIFHKVPLQDRGHFCLSLEQCVCNTLLHPAMPPRNLSDPHWLPESSHHQGGILCFSRDRYPENLRSWIDRLSSSTTHERISANPSLLAE